MVLPDDKGFSLFEVLLVVFVLGVLLLVMGSVFLPGSRPVQRSQAMQVVSHARQLHTATYAMAQDRREKGKTNVGWPGDTGGSFAGWGRQMLEGGYLKADDFCRLLSSAGDWVTSGDLPRKNGQDAFWLYATREASPSNAVFITTANFTYTATGGSLSSQGPLHGEVFVVFHQAGDGAVYKPEQAGADTNVLGSFVPVCR